MEKYLFIDGTNVIREVESKEELAALIQSTADPKKVRIWVFNTSEWISISDFNKRSFKPVSPPQKNKPVVQDEAVPKPRPSRIRITGLWKKALIAIITAAAILLVYNFTRVTWKKADPLNISAARPDNTPEVNADSLIETIEALRGQKLDKVTRTNLRIRNTWPDLIQLQLDASRDVSREGTRYYNLELTIDNSTGYNLDNAVVELATWKNNAISDRDTFRFANIGYASPAKRKIATLYQGDSIAVSFSTIKSKVFNFCYSSDKKSNYGNYNDRWFCKE
jgi:hypothetical protein